MKEGDSVPRRVRLKGIRRCRRGGFHEDPNTS